jgi:hypothetical protein
MLLVTTEDGLIFAVADVLIAQVVDAEADTLLVLGMATGQALMLPPPRWTSDTLDIAAMHAWCRTSATWLVETAAELRAGRCVELQLSSRSLAASLRASLEQLRDAVPGLRR